MEYITQLNYSYQAMGFQPYKWTQNGSAPFTRLTKPVRECTVAMLTTGGISLTTEPAWNPMARDDFRVDAIPGSKVEHEDYQVHDSCGWPAAFSPPRRLTTAAAVRLPAPVCRDRHQLPLPGAAAGGAGRGGRDRQGGGAPLQWIHGADLCAHPATVAPRQTGS